MAPRVCFLALNAYPTLAGTTEARVGGAEVQQCLIARYLVRRGYSISFVTLDYGQPDGEKVNGITVYRAFKMNTGIRYLRFIHPRMTGIWAALRRADADIYYQRCAGMETGLLAAFCRRHNRKFVFSAASETDFDLERAIIPRWFDCRLYVYGLRCADAIVIQTERQRALLQETFGLDGNLIPNCWAEEPPAAKGHSEPDAVLWVGMVRDLKRPELFLDLAASLPKARFVMVGGRVAGEGTLYDRVVKRAQGIPNLFIAGFVPFHEVGRFFDQALLVVNTSPKEGFPNTFLQAWCRGLPVVSFYDPDRVIQRHQLGFAVNSLDSMRQKVVNLLNDKDLYGKIRQNVLQYFQANHRLEKLGPRYEALFSELVK